MSSAISKAQIRAIHTLKGNARLTDDTYRALLARDFGVSSSTELDQAKAGRLIEELKVLSGDVPASRESSSRIGGALNLSGPYAGICRALWMDCYHVGLVEHREDTALVAFVKRQTGIDHLNWVREPADANKVIEALKAMLGRAGVDWSKPKGDRRTEADRVIAAQLKLLGGDRGSAGALVALWEQGNANPRDRVRIMQMLGTMIRQRRPHV